MKILPQTLKWPISLFICVLITLGTVNSIFSLLALLMCLCVIVLCDDYDTLCIMFAIMPFANIFKGGPGAQSYFTYLLLLYVIWRFLLKPKVVTMEFVTVLFFAIYILAVQIANDTLHITKYIKLIAGMLFLYYAIDDQRGKDPRDLFLMYIFGMLLSSLVVVSGLFPRIILYVGEVEFGETVRFTGLYSDPNYYVVNAIVSLCLLIILYHNGEINSQLTLSVGILFIFFIGLTSSKSGLLMLVLVLCFLIVSNAKNRKHFQQVLILTIIAVVISMVLSGKISIFDTVLSRLTKADDIDSFTTGRSEIWKAYMTYFADMSWQVIFGQGLGAGLINGRASHNVYIEFIYYLGIWGSIVFVVMILMLYKKSKANPINTAHSILNYSVVMSLGAMYFFLSQLFGYDLPFHVLLLFIVLRIDIKDGSSVRRYNYTQSLEKYRNVKM